MFTGGSKIGIFSIRRIGALNTAERHPQYGVLTRSFRRIEKLTELLIYKQYRYAVLQDCV
ncbi:hypothetical protein B5F77_05370 [Parabacteroides sp. An277]|nr:hypothetical protein B5F77_05370 [Parabacteroides sp. An277]